MMVLPNLSQSTIAAQSREPAPSSHPGEWRRGARTARPTARNAHCRKPARRSAGVLAGQQQRTALCDETAIGIGDRTDGEF
jgi:hypothetical protein